MKVAIIGAGNVGGALARATSRAGHEVVVAAKTPEHVQALVTELGVTGAQTAAQAAEGADIVVLAVPWGEVNAVVDGMSGALEGKIVIDATNPLSADGSGLAVEGRSGAELVQDRIPGAKVVKAFNTVFAANQADPQIDGTPLDGFVAGDDADAKGEVLELVSKMGYRAIDAGPLSAASYLEGMAYLNIWLNMTNGWSWRTAWRLDGHAA